MLTLTEMQTNGTKPFADGLISHQRGDLGEAQQLYRETMRIDPSHSEASHLLGVVALQQGRVAESIEQLRKAIALDPLSPQIHNNLAAAYRAIGDMPAAIEQYRRAVVLDPKYVTSYENLGTLQFEMGEFAEAYDCFNQVLRLAPESESAGKSAALCRQHIEDSHDERPPPSEILTATAQKTVLHVGCGLPNPASLHERFRHAEWKEVRLDIDPRAQPDVVASLTDMSPVDCDAVDAVWSSHNIEHLYAHEVPVALAEFFRVLRPGGLLLVTLPDLQQMAHFIVDDKLDEVAYESPAGPITPLDCLFGHGPSIANGNAFMAHKTGFTAKSLTRRVADAGFEVRKCWTTPFNLWIEAEKPRRMTDAGI